MIVNSSIKFAQKLLILKVAWRMNMTGITVVFYSWSKASINFCPPSLSMITKTLSFGVRQNSLLKNHLDSNIVFWLVNSNIFSFENAHVQLAWVHGNHRMMRKKKKSRKKRHGLISFARSNLLLWSKNKHSLISSRRVINMCKNLLLWANLWNSGFQMHRDWVLR